MARLSEGVMPEPPVTPERLSAALEACRLAVRQALETATDSYASAGLLYEAMRYSALDGGKMIRAFICTEVCRMLSGDENCAVAYSAATELMHASSLVHDDMPEMDNDAVRRGKPTCHVSFGTAEALLTGDSLICLSFECAAKADAARAARAVLILADAGGAGGITAGQLLDKQAENRDISYGELIGLQRLKTGRLMRAAALLGALAANAGEKETADCAAFAENVGLAFQIKDDLLDAADGGGSDSTRGAATFLSFLEPKEAQLRAERYTADACAAIEKYPRSGMLCALARYLLNREY